jgi:hypothetical protein
MVRPMRPFTMVSCALLVAGLPGCERNKPSPDPGTSRSATNATVAASAPTPATAASASAAAPVGPPPVCRIDSKKTWGSGANKLTGLTEADLPDGRAAIGLAFGLQPHVLVISTGGEGKLAKLQPRAGTHIATPPKGAEGSRHLYRVTPVKVDGANVQAFVDYRDELRGKRRRVACGPVDSDDSWVAFDEVPFFDRDPRPTGEALNALFARRGDDWNGYHEVRDCRTFADVSRGEAWILGSGLHGDMRASGEIKWRSTLFVDTGAKTHERHLHHVDLTGDPPKMADYEVPVSRRLDDGSFLVAMRNRSSLLVGLLGPDKSLRGDLSSYPGFPTLPDLADDGDDVILSTSVALGKGEFGLRALRIASSKPVLPRAYAQVVTDEQGQGSETDPDFTRDLRGQRWMAHVEGERGKGRLSIAPIGADFRAVGRPYTISAEGERISSARLVPMKDGGILVVFLRETDKTVELVTEDLHCEVAR